MSLHLLTPDDSGTCCDCQPTVCAACDLCPAGESVELVLSGLAACCNASNQKLDGLDALNGTHTLARIGEGDYFLALAEVLEQNSYGLPDCAEPPGSTLGGIDVNLEFICFDDFAELTIRIAAGGAVLFYDAIDAPATAGEPFVFTGVPSCTALQPFTFGGTATVTPA